VEEALEAERTGWFKVACGDDPNSPQIPACVQKIRFSVGADIPAASSFSIAKISSTIRSPVPRSA